MKIGKTKFKKVKGTELKIAVVFSKFNDTFGKDLLFNTVQTLKNYGVKEITIEKVPGSLEIPICAHYLAQQNKYDAIIALGIVLKGKTYHFELVCHEAYRGLMNVSINNNLPVIYGIICGQSKQQIKERCSADKLNKGQEFAQSAIEMALLRKKYQ
jgi:6,7-dimethyl-8-ribityllumazine synthase